MGNVRRPSKRHESTSRQPAWRVRLRVLWCEVRCAVVVVDQASWEVLGRCGRMQEDAGSRGNAAEC